MRDAIIFEETEFRTNLKFGKAFLYKAHKAEHRAHDKSDPVSFITLMLLDVALVVLGLVCASIEEVIQT